MNKRFTTAILAAIIALSSLAVMVSADESAPESGSVEETGGGNLYCVPINTPTPEPEAEEGSRESYIEEWNNAPSNYERYNMSATAKAKIVDLSMKDFDFFARVVQAEGDIRGDDLTDKVLVACVIWNRLYCKKYPNSIPKVLRQRGQFEVVENGLAARRKRTKDSEWAIMVAYMLVRRNDISPHLMAFNCVNYNHGYAPYFYYGGNYFSCGVCHCSRCESIEPDFRVSGYPRWTQHFTRPVYVEPDSGQITAEEVMARFSVRFYSTPVDADNYVPVETAPAEEVYSYNNLIIE